MFGGKNKKRNRLKLISNCNPGKQLLFSVKLSSSVSVYDINGMVYEGKNINVC